MFDYSQPGRYFLTICTRNKAALFGEVAGNGVVLSKLGQIADESWREIPCHFLHVQLITHVVMPDHLHGILVLKAEERYAAGLPQNEPSREFAKPIRGSIATIVGAFKAAVSRRVPIGVTTAASSMWQRGYYEHTIRSDKDFQEACEYIRMNPARHTFKQKS